MRLKPQCYFKFIEYYVMTITVHFRLHYLRSNEYKGGYMVIEGDWA